MTLPPMGPMFPPLGPTPGAALLVACEAHLAFDTHPCPHRPANVVRLAHVGADSSSCTTGDFALCTGHLTAIRTEVAKQLRGHTAPRCEGCRYPMRAVSDVVVDVRAAR